MTYNRAEDDLFTPRVGLRLKQNPQEGLEILLFHKLATFSILLHNKKII